MDTVMTTRQVRSYLESVGRLSPGVAVMEESATASGTWRVLVSLVLQYGFSYGMFDLRDLGAVQYRRRRLIAWRVG